MTDDDSATTVEWGSTAAESAAERVNGRRWWPRRAAAPAGPESGAAEPRTGPAAGVGRLRISPVGLSCAVVGFGLTLAAEVLPWISVRLGSLRDPSNGEILPSGSNGTVDLALDRLPNWQALMYNVVWVVVFVFVAVSLVSDARLRRTAVAAGLGAAAGQVTLLVGLAHGLNDGVGVLSDTLSRPGGSPPIEFGAGVYAAFGAVLVSVAALVFAGRTRAARPAGLAALAGPDESTVAPAGPADLTVSPFAPSQDGIST